MAYYFHLIRTMYFEEPEGAAAAAEPAAAGPVLLAACALPTAALGLCPGLLVRVADWLRAG
jgi:NADH:ubiquinone oxidoreductase subunit 2 (subunit N)